RDGELNFRRIRPAKAEGAKALRREICRTETTEMRPPARARFIQHFLRKLKTNYALIVPFGCGISH
ncbi:MAG: hypothetical protein RSC06_14925, partial [Clostridia bacterium]